MAIKMYCVFSLAAIKAMGGNRGKMSSQSGHAYLHAWWDSVRPLQQPDIKDVGISYALSDKAYKITLAVETTAELVELAEKYKTICGVSLVTDAGYTVFEGATTTCLGIGPLRDEDKGEDLKALRPFI